MGERLSGILLHPTALPGRHGIGDVGADALRWLDWLAAAGQRVWQVLPLGPAGFSGSPYDSPSSAAGDPMLVSLDALAEEGLLDAEALAPEPPFAASPVDLGAVRRWKGERLRAAWEALRSRRPDDPLVRELDAWGRSPAQASWCEEWALFAALRDRFEQAWPGWPPELRDRHPEAIAAARAELQDDIGYHRFVQFFFWRQWKAVRRRAARRGIRILGDLPIYTALDSVGVWTHRELFDLDAEGRPRHLSGVPPDAFSDDGQLWGHPLYLWDRMREDGYRWWIERLRQAFRQADVVRLDHFRAFAAYWEVPAGAETAAAGRWRRGPGGKMFAAARRELGELTMVAEDLGVITPAVRRLRRRLGMPGIRVLQFGLEEGAGEHLPSSWGPELLVCTATHDNDTSVGWFANLEPEIRQQALRLLDGGEEINWSMIRAVLGSAAETAVIPLQDVLGLGSEARFNTPGTDAGNWGWRFEWPQLRREICERLRRLTELARRRAAEAAPSG